MGDDARRTGAPRGERTIVVGHSIGVFEEQEGRKGGVEEGKGRRGMVVTRSRNCTHDPHAKNLL